MQESYFKAPCIPLCPIHYQNQNIFQMRDPGQNNSKSDMNLFFSFSIIIFSFIRSIFSELVQTILSFSTRAEIIQS